MEPDDILDELEEAVIQAARLLAKRINDGSASAADISLIRAMHRDAGGTLNFKNKPTVSGDKILESMADIDLDMLRH
jgi:hypothetical protein